MKSSIRAALVAGALVLASAQASASSVNLSANGDYYASDFLPPSPATVTITVSGSVSGAVFKLADTLVDGYTVDYQLYDSGMNAVGASWTMTDLGVTSLNLAQAGVYRALSTGTYYLQYAFNNGDPLAIGVTTQISAVPLPAAAWLFGSALLGFGAMRRKQKGSNKTEMAVA